MPKKYVKKTDRQYASSKTIPEKFKTGFLGQLDKRTDLAKALRRNYEQIVADVGGMSEVGHIKSSLVERYVWLETILQALEQELATGEADRGKVLGQWVQAVNSLSGLAKVLGVERRAKEVFWGSSPTPAAPTVEPPAGAVIVTGPQA